jgi:hypothetical protein
MLVSVGIDVFSGVRVIVEVAVIAGVAVITGAAVRLADGTSVGGLVGMITGIDAAPWL